MLQRRSIAVAMGIGAAFGGEMGEEWFEALTGSPGMAKFAMRQQRRRTPGDNQGLSQRHIAAGKQHFKRITSKVTEAEKEELAKEFLIWKARYEAKQQKA
jgi:hypothetical protein